MNFDYFETNYIGELRSGRRLLPIFPHELRNMHKYAQLNNFRGQITIWRMAHSFLHHVQTNTSINLGVYQHIKTRCITQSDANSANISWWNPVTTKKSLSWCQYSYRNVCASTAQKMKFSIKDFLSKYDQSAEKHGYVLVAAEAIIRRFLRKFG